MRRRTILATFGTALLGGCASLNRSPAEPSPSPAPVPSDSPEPDHSPPGDHTDEPSGPRESWSLVDFETIPVTVSLTRTRARTADDGQVVMQFVRTATADHPAAIRGTFTNANSFANTFDLQGLPLFRNVPAAWPGGRPRSDEYTYRDELVLAPTENHDLAETAPEWSLADDERWRLVGGIDGPWLPESLRLAAGESFEFEYALLGRPEGVGFPRARYHFDGYDRREVIFSVWTTDRPGPTADTRFDGASPTTLPEVDRMAWYHEADPGTAAYLQPSAEHAELPAKIEYTLVNHSRQVVSGNPYFWRLWKRVDGEWFHVAPWGWPVPLAYVPPGGTMDWTLAAFDDHPIRCDGANSVGHLGGGRYAFEVDVGPEGVTPAALLDVAAPEVTVEPMDGLKVTRDGAAVQVEWPRREGELPRATLTLARARDADARLIAEQVMQSRNAALRNTVPFLKEDIERVTLVTDRNTVSRGARTGGYEDGSFRFRFRGQAYEASASIDDNG